LPGPCQSCAIFAPVGAESAHDPLESLTFRTIRVIARAHGERCPCGRVGSHELRLSEAVADRLRLTSSLNDQVAEAGSTDRPVAGHWCFVVVAGLASVLSAAVTGDLGSGTLAAGTRVSAAAIMTIFRVTSGRPTHDAGLGGLGNPGDDVRGSSRRWHRLRSHCQQVTTPAPRPPPRSVASKPGHQN